MDFKVRLDDDANLYLSDVSGRNSGVEVTDTELCVSLGKELALRVPLNAVSGVEQIADPRPAVYLPLGVSAAVETLGRNTIAAIGSYDGQVMIHFSEPVQAQIAPTGGSKAERVAADRVPVQLENLIISLEDPAGFVEAMGSRVSPQANAPTA